MKDKFCLVGFNEWPLIAAHHSDTIYMCIFQEDQGQESKKPSSSASEAAKDEPSHNSAGKSKREEKVVKPPDEAQSSDVKTQAIKDVQKFSPFVSTEYLYLMQ